MRQTMAAGSISADEFRSLAENFADTSSKIDDGWHLETLKDSVYLWKKSHVPGAVQLDKEQKCVDEKQEHHLPFVASDLSMSGSDFVNTGKTWNSRCGEDAEENTQYCDEMEIEEDDDQCMPAGLSASEVLTYEYHVLYSESYGVPVLYANIYKQDGKLLPLDKVWGMCPPSFQKQLHENRWTTLTQQEHPLLGRPFLQLHPCHTADLMTQVLTKSVGSNRQNYLATWLSTVGPMFGLHISPSYIIQSKG